MEKVNVKKKNIQSEVQSKHEMKVKVSIKNERQKQKDGRSGLGTSYSLSVSRTAENLSSIDYWDLMFQSTLLPSLYLSFPLSFTLPLYLSLYHVLSAWHVSNLNVQNRGSKVSQSTFPFC